MNKPTLEQFKNALSKYGEDSAVFSPFSVDIEREEYTDHANPRDCDNNGYMACCHPRYTLGDKDGLTDLFSALTRLVEAAGIAKYPNHDFLIEMERLECPVCDGEGCIHCDDDGDIPNKYFVCPYDSEEQAIAKMLEFDIDYSKQLIVLPLYLYDHSGITISTTSFVCRWDSGQVGWIFTTPARMKDLGHNIEDFSDEAKREEIESWLRSEVKAYDEYLQGNVYLYNILDSDGCELDSCGGFLGDHEASGLLEHAHIALICEMESAEKAAAAERRSYFTRLKSLIRHHVPLSCRELVLDGLKPESF